MIARLIGRRALNYLLFLFITVVAVGPFLWLISTALKGPADNIFSYPPKFIPNDFTLSNFAQVFDTVPFLRYYVNSMFVAASVVVLNIVLGLMAAFPLSRIEFKGRRIIFLLILSTLMIPFQIAMIPLFVLAVEFGMRNTYIGLILPKAIFPFSVFILRQAFRTIPSSLEESAIIYGAKSWQVLLYILTPLARSSIAALTVFAFIFSWSDFLWPLILLEDQMMYTIPVGVAKLQGTFTNNWRLISAGSILSIIPVVIIFAFAQKQFIKGALAGSVKG